MLTPKTRITVRTRFSYFEKLTTLFKYVNRHFPFWQSFGFMWTPKIINCNLGPFQFNPGKC